ncbi:hypothetical protein CK503_09215 [Aliifodinibius salipaludis]|uniref:Uncharacterized protein n=1 Tax=Fodinibius salipaludis TaxID=2032627 RepID=A0A2A2GAG3_9BACT|nr:hypothetical protein [Aliifodinibius salipaludis]PAU93843.1 hypothetical protein CK503_09215 [Aliifodinibius salipaludis]
MNESDILASAKTIEEHSLSQLQYWLQYEKYSCVAGAGIVWMPYGLIMMGLLILAVLFTPFMLWHLFKAKWYKSIGIFLATVIIPLIISQLFDIGNTVADFLLMVLPLFTFYGYTWILSYVIGNHLNEMETVKKWQKEQLLNDY